MLPLRSLLSLGCAGLLACSPRTEADDGVECTAIGCSDGISVTAHTASGRIDEGTFTFRIDIDAARVTCTLAATPLSSTGQPSPSSGSCDGTQVSLSLQSQTQCEEIRTDEASGQRCVPIDGQWDFTMWIAGAPNGVHVQVERDGALLADRTLDLGYQDVRPNGPRCEPVCSQAPAQELTLVEGE